jgi:bacteriorhodopsin
MWVPHFFVGMAGWIVHHLRDSSRVKLPSSTRTAETPPLSRLSEPYVRSLHFGWAIYPIGYYLAYMGGGTHDSETLNIVYNLADLVNKAAFGLAIWVAATSDSEQTA